MAERRTWNATVVLLVCLALAGTTLAAATGRATGKQAPPKGPATRVVEAARQLVGEKPYAWGAAGPHAYDCSGLTSRLWSTVGGVRTIPRTSRQQQAWAIPIPREQAVIGDLAFFGEPVSHVGVITQRLRDGRLRMVDASASRKGVVERLVWTTGTVRFGRVPRPSMPKVRPWTPRPAKAAPPAVPTRPVVDPRHPALAGRDPVVGLRRVQTGPSSPAMLRFARLAQQQVGARTWTDTGLVTTLWRRAGGAGAPDSRAGIAARTHRVPLHEARVGDLVVYAAPGDHVGVYVGGGWMVDDSQRLGKVVRRPVWAAPGVSVVRWNR